MAEPMTKPSTRDDAAFVAEIKRSFSDAQERDKHNRDRALEDAEFEADTGDGKGVTNGVWPSSVRRQREQDGRICLTINKSRTITRQVANELRLQPPSIKVSPAEDGDAQVASVLEGLCRSIEQASKARRTYARAGEDAARGNMGFWRVQTGYVSEDSFDQELLIKPILNPMSVVYGDHEDSTCRDARRCWVFDDVPKDEFEARWKGKATADFYADGSAYMDGEWIKTDTVRVCEYWCVEEESETLYLLSDGSTRWKDSKDPWPFGATVVRDRKSTRKSVRQYIVSGAEVLEENDWLGDRIPIVPVWGEEARIGSRRVRNGVLTYARDAVRLHSFARSANAETVATQPKAPWLVTPKMVEGHETMWREAANGNPTVLYFNPDATLGAGGKPERMPPPSPSGGWVQEALQSADDIKSTTGIFDASLGQRSNETSGKAIMARQREGDVGTYTFIDNVMDAIEETGRILIDMIPKIYDAPRQVRILGKKMEAMIVAVNQDGGINLRDAGRYDVTVTSGNVTTQRQETVEVLTDTLQAAPLLAPVILPRLAALVDLPDADEFAEEVRQLLQPQPQEPEQINPKDAASAEKMQAETVGIHLENVAKADQLEAGHHLMGFAEEGPEPGMGPQDEPDAPGGNQGPIA